MNKTWWLMGFPRPGLHRGRVKRWVPKGKGKFFARTGTSFLGLTYLYRRGICLTSRWPLYSGLFPAEGMVENWEFPSMKKKTALGGPGDGKHLAAMETNLFHQHQSLVEHCALRKYDDGDAREVGWFTIKTVGAAWIVQVKDPDSCASFSAVADTLDKALDTAALLLSCDEAPWEQDVWLKQAQQKKNKK